LPLVRSNRSNKALLFAQNFLRYPKMIGSIIPSSRFLIERLLSRVDWEHARVIVEYGPGVGTITKHVLRQLAPDAVLIAIEMNGDFVEHLRQELPDPRLRVVHGSAADVRNILAQQGFDSADYIISGIPYSTLPEPLRHAVLRESRAALSPHGRMLVYQFTRAVLPYLRREFGHVQQEFEPLNILPAQVFTCEKSNNVAV